MTTQRNVTIVLVGLGLVTLLGLGFMGVLAILERPVPDAIQLTTAGALGAFGGVLANTRSTFGEKDIAPPVMQATVATPQPVEVVNTPDAPAQVELAAADPTVAGRRAG